MFERITGRLADVVKTISGKSSISEKNIQDAVEQIKIALLEADVNVRVVRRFVNRTMEEAVGEKVLRAVNPGQQFIKIIYDRMVSMLGDTKQDLNLKGPDTLSVLLLMGLQGSGKTTTAAKLAAHLTQKGRKVLIAAADLVRPAAIDQLHILGEQIGVAVFSDKNQKDPVAIVKAAEKKALKEGYDTLICDTAGRLHVEDDLMEELLKIKKALNPDECLFVADSMTGQKSVDIAAVFQEKIGLTGAIFTKFDSDARGGAVFSFKSVTDKPVKFIGVGEKITDFQPFYPDRMASRILGMGDVVSLVEKAQEVSTMEEAVKIAEKLSKNEFTFEDYLDQFQKVRKMGSLKSLVEMIPGLSGKISEQQINEKDMKREEAIIFSMTRKERVNARIIGPSRKKRIAIGSGTSVFEVNQLLKKFDKTKLMMKKMAGNPKYQEQIMSQLNG